MPQRCFINAIGTAVPEHEVHNLFIAWASERVTDRRNRAIFSRMASRSGITHRYSVLDPQEGRDEAVAIGGFYGGETLPPTSARMQVYARAAPALMLRAIADLGEGDVPPGITHLVVASCTGFVAPGIDQIIARSLGLPDRVERLLIGFMGCYAAASALRSARHIVRSQPGARVLVVCIELCTLHLQQTSEIESLLAMLQFADGAAAALVSGTPEGIEMGEGFSHALPRSDTMIRWDIGDQGFAMQLSGEVPAAIGAALTDPEVQQAILDGDDPADLGWAVHTGGRSILDAVEQALALPPEALRDSRAILDAYGNMSSATLMFVLKRMMAAGPREKGVAIAFGPGLAAEGFRFARAA